MGRPETEGRADAEGDRSAAPDSSLLALESTVAALGETLLAPGTGAAAEEGDEDLGSPRYRVAELLGEGGMGRVDRVWDVDLMRSLAVKQLRSGLRDVMPLVRRFLWEARVSAHLDHPNIVPVHDLGRTPEGALYFTMKHVQGMSLHALIEGLRAGDTELVAENGLMRRLRIFLDVCDALTFAHGKGVLHRDLKPANIMLGEHGEVLVMDWGLATTLDTAEGRALRALMPDAEDDGTASSGTPLYMSPEQARSEPLDALADVYTLGVILYELVSLESPYDATTVPEVLLRITRGEVRPLSGVASDLPTSLVAVVERAMATAKNERYPSVAALRRDVEKVVDGRTPDAEDASIVTRVGRFYGSRNPILARIRMIDIELIVTGSLLVGGGCGALVAGATGWWAWTVLVVGMLSWIPPARSWIRAMRELS